MFNTYRKTNSNLELHFFTTSFSSPSQCSFKGKYLTFFLEQSNMYEGLPGSGGNEKRGSTFPWSLEKFSFSPLFPINNFHCCLNVSDKVPINSWYPLFPKINLFIDWSIEINDHVPPNPSEVPIPHVLDAARLKKYSAYEISILT